MHEDFLRAIHNKNIIVIRFNSNEKGIISKNVFLLTLDHQDVIKINKIDITYMI